MIIAWKNYIENSVLTESSAKSGFPPGNVAISQLARVFKFDGNSGNLVIDLGADYQITVISLGNTNISSSGTLTIEGNSSDSWTSPPYQESVTIDDNTTNQILILDKTYRYFRIVMDDSTLSDIQIGHILIGNYLTMPGFLVTKPEPKKTSSYGNLSLTLQWYGNRGLTYKNPSFDFPVITEAQKKEIESMFEHVQNTEPVYMVTFENDLDYRPPLFCIINQDQIEFEKIQIDNYTFRLDFLEIK